MRACEQSDIPFFQFESLIHDGQLDHAVFTRQGGVSPAPFRSLNLSVSVPDNRDSVYRNRRRAYGIYGRDTDSVVHAHLVHGADVARVTQADNGTWISRVDGIVTNEAGCALTMNFADCSPIFLYDPVKQAIGLGHAGWQGAARDLPGAMVCKMQAEFGSRPADLIAAIGPSIGPCCYEVGEPVITAMREAFEEVDDLFTFPRVRGNPASSAGRPHLDLPRANKRNLERAGVKKIESSGFCTACCTDLFYSHRGENGRTGRFGTLLILN